MYRILPYSIKSTSARLLAEGLGALRIYPRRNTYQRKENHKLVNWGCSSSPYYDNFREGDFNHPQSVAFATDKIVTFEMLRLHHIPVPDWTISMDEALQWLDVGDTVYGRDTETGHGGSGIHVYNNNQEELRSHRFYTKKVKNHIEYRIHIGDNTVIDITQKKVKNGHGDVNRYVRSYDNGWVFCRNNLTEPSPSLIETAKDAVWRLNLDFGAVDICTSKEGKVTVFEVNTAPGIEGTTLKKYIEFFKERENE